MVSSATMWLRLVGLCAVSLLTVNISAQTSADDRPSISHADVTATIGPKLRPATILRNSPGCGLRAIVA
jgi:hypothetical protein